MAKNPPKQQEQEAAAADEAAPPKKKGKKLLLMLVALLVLAGGGAAAWFFVFKDKGEHGAPQESKLLASKPPVFVNLEPFTVNLQPESGEQYLQVVATLKVLDTATGDAVKLHMPEIRHRLLLLLSSKKASEIGSVQGRERLSEEMRHETDLILWAAAGKTPPAPEAPPKPIAEAPKTEESTEAGQPGAQAAAPNPAPAATAQGQPASPAAPKAAADDPVQAVFFTSFIIQ